jgi:uncharacterized protein (TIGR02246 family)
MNWKPIAVTVVIGAAIAPLVSQSQQPARIDQKKAATKTAQEPGARPEVADARAKEITALEATAQAFADAFNRGDAKAVAALWTRDGEYIDVSGQRLEGRDAIEKQYAGFFEAHPGAKITLSVDALRLAGDNTAIEDGRAMVELGPIRSGDYGKYTVVHVKADGKWLMSSVRDTRIESSSPTSRLGDLQWLEGSWSAEDYGAKMEVDCRWIAQNSFLVRSYSVKRSDQIVDSGLQVIGWNPQTQQIQSWVFASHGGHAVGLWNETENGWAIETAGTLADGTPTRAVNLVTRLDNNGIVWRSIERSAGDIPLADTDEVLLKRAAASSK